MSHTTGPDAQRLYEDVLRRAMRLAAPHVPWDQAFEVAHDVAIEIVRRTLDPPAGTSPPVVTGPLIVTAVTNRLRNSWRSVRRRSAAESVHSEERASLASAWSEPGTDIETGELQRVVDTTLSTMPEGMRAVFRLVREEERSYKETAAALGIGVGTVHTQLSRANALLRRAIESYRSGTSDSHDAGDARHAMMRNR
jgi:RNA polymerase sigma-70 factor (ECF subfamily)